MSDDLIMSPPLSISELQAAAHAAMQRRDFLTAVDAWQHFRERRPDHPDGFISGIVALQSLRRLEEADALASLALSRFPNSAGLLSACAYLAVARGHWQQGETHWHAFLALAPHYPKGVVGLAQAQAALGKLTDAEATLATALKQDPGRFEFLAAQAELSARTRDWKMAEQRWKAVNATHQDQLVAIEGLAEALIQQKNADAAHTLLERALRLFPASRNLNEAWARVAVLQANWAAAERRWADTAQRFPASALASHGVAFARMKQGDLVGADSLAAEAVARFPGNTLMLSTHAAIAASRGDWPEAESRAERLRRVAPASADGWLQQAHARRAQGRLDEAAALLAEAVTILPSDPTILQLQYEMALARGDWANISAHQWRLFQASPADRSLQGRSFNADWRCLGSLSDADASTVLLRDSRLPDNADRNLMLRFEGFGGSHEFAEVQSRFGAEPVALLRWSEITTDQLIQAVATGLDGIGDEQNVRLRVTVDYKMRDRRHDITFHTFVQDEQPDPDHFFQTQCKRLRYLRRELLSDLEESEKIFVHKASVVAPMEQVLKLHKAIRQHGTATLLYVQLADNDHPGGTLEQVAPGLLMGYLSRVFSNRIITDIAFDEWFEICRKAVALVDCEDAVPKSMRELILRFESLGDNCEFGFVQRLVQGEPIGLFRWTLVTLPALAEAVASGLQGIGDPAGTDLHASGDYLAFDPRFQLAMRTFVQSDNVDRDSFYAEQCRRVIRLRNALLADLRSGQKIFVHKPINSVGLDTVRALSAMMRSYGPTTLLHVCSADPNHPNGSVRWEAPGLLIGYLDFPPNAGSKKIDHASWHTLLRHAIAIAD